MSSISYQVSINNPGGAGEPNNGFIDPTPLAKGTNIGSATYDLARAKKRGNFRFQRIVQVLGTVANPLVSSIVTSATATTEGTNIQFVVTFERGAVRIIRDENELTGTLAIQQLIAEAVTEDFTRTTDIIDPAINKISHVISLQVGPIFGSVATAKAQITVTSI